MVVRQSTGHDQTPKLLPTHLNRVKLHTCLHNIDGTQSTVGDGAADTTSSGTFQVVHHVIFRARRGRGEKDGSGKRRHGGGGGERLSKEEKVESLFAKDDEKGFACVVGRGDEDALAMLNVLIPTYKARYATEEGQTFSNG